MISFIWFLCIVCACSNALLLPQPTSFSAARRLRCPVHVHAVGCPKPTPSATRLHVLVSSSRAQDDGYDNENKVAIDDDEDVNDNLNNSIDDDDNNNNNNNNNNKVNRNNHHLTDPTTLFNNDIYRIASRTKMASTGSSSTAPANFNPIHAAEHAERMLLQMIEMYHSSNRKTARPNIETFQIVLMGYANLKGYRWDNTDHHYGGNKNDSDNHAESNRRPRPFGYSSSAFTNTWGDEFLDRIQQQQQQQQQNSENFENGEHYFDDSNVYNYGQSSSSTSISGTLTCAADRVDFIMAQLHKLQQSEIEAGNDISNLQLNTNVCNLCLLAYARCSYPQTQHSNSNNVDHHKYGNDNNLIDPEKQTQQMKNPFLSPVTQSESNSYAERAERLVKYMLYLNKTQKDDRQQQQAGTGLVQPNCQTYSYLIWSLSRQQPDVRRHQKRKWNNNNNNNKNRNVIDSHFAMRASEWIPHLESLYENFSTEREIHRGEYEYGEECGPEQTQKFRHHNRRLLRKYLVWAYSDVLSAWSKCSEKKSPKKVYKYMTAIEQICEEDKEELYNTHMQKEHNQEPKQMMHVDDRDNVFIGSNVWLSNTNDEYEPYLDQNIPLYPSAQCYTQAILSLSKSKELGSAQRANNLLYKMLEIYDSGEWGRQRPGVYAFNGVISAWANCASSSLGNADKAEKILNLMEDLYFDQDKSEYDHLRPDSISYNTAIKAWTTSKEDAAMFRAEKLVERMEKRYDAIGDDFLDVKPDSYTYNTMITGWLRSDLGIVSAENAEALLQRMVKKYLDGDIDLEPNQKIFSSIIDKWAKSDPKKNVAVKRSIDLLHLMESLYESGCDQLRPDKITYTNIIDAIARSRSPTGAEMALSLLEKMETKYQNGDRHIQPSAQTYSCTLLSLLNSNMDNKHIIAQNIPKRMKEIGVDPNAFTWNYIIHVASMVGGNEQKKMEAFKVALGAFQALRKSEEHNTDSYTYTFFLKAINHLMPQSVMRSSIIKETFLECVNEGKVNDQVLSRLVFAIPQEEAREIIGPIRISDIRNVKAHHVPRDWGRNVYKKK